MTERDDFDKIVEGLDLDLSFVDEMPEAVVTPPPRPSEPAVADEVPAYRQVSPTSMIPRRRGTILGWAAVLLSPVVLIVATLMSEILPRPMLIGDVLIFVAGAIYLIAQLPEHGPSRRDWPDDGAVL